MLQTKIIEYLKESNFGDLRKKIAKWSWKEFNFVATWVEWALVASESARFLGFLAELRALNTHTHIHAHIQHANVAQKYRATKKLFALRGKIGKVCERHIHTHTLVCWYIVGTNWTKEVQQIKWEKEYNFKSKNRKGKQKLAN